MTGDYASLRRKDHVQHPAGRVGKPQDIAEMVAFLLDGERQASLPARISLDGGMTRKMVYEDSQFGCRTLREEPYSAA
jgi:NAD(P)-dependent dehydrogenase (short-subunit alcohol dehydrogenase family)